MKKYNVEFAYYDPDGREPFSGIYDDPINDEPIEAETPEEAEAEARSYAEKEIIANNQGLTGDEIQTIIDTWNASHVARVSEIEE